MTYNEFKMLYWFAEPTDENIEKLFKHYNQIQHTLWMARADKYKERMRRFGLLAYHYACEGEGKDSKKTKCTRIMGLCEARERKCREKAKEFEG